MTDGKGGVLIVSMGRNKKIVIDKHEEKRGREDLYAILLSIKSQEEMESFLDDMLTDNEIRDVIQRYLLMDDLWKGKSQRDIAADRSMSLCRITRGSKMLKKKGGFMRRYFEEKYDDYTHI